MRCAKCNISGSKAHLERVSPEGETPVLWCMKCIQLHEPELYRNILEENREAQASEKRAEDMTQEERTAYLIAIAKRNPQTLDLSPYVPQNRHCMDDVSPFTMHENHDHLY